MKFSTTVMTYDLSTALLVSAAPLSRRAGTGTTKQMATTRLDASGAVYCMYSFLFRLEGASHAFPVLTNEPDENQIIAASINADGTLVSGIYQSR